MAGCPNCGRRTLRTKDWVCQWCGYPLLSGSYKQIDKTFKEFQEERNSSWKSVKPEPEPEFNFETEPAPEPQEKPKSAPEPERQPGPELEAEPEPKAKIAPEPEPEAEQEPKAEITPEPELAAQPGPEPAPQPESEPILLPEPEPAPQLEPQPEAPTRPEAVAPAAQEMPSEPLTVPDLGSIKDGSELTIDQIDALFQADSAGANAALKDKTVIIKGMVNKVFIRDHLDIRYMMLNGTRKGLWNVRCGFGKESSPQMSRLSEGQAVALRGRYDGFSKNIIFKDCVLVG